MRLSITNIFLILICFWLQACDSTVQEKGNGNIISRERDLEPFKKIAVNGNLELVLKKATSPGITIITDENLHNFINIDQDDDVLKIATGKRLKSKSAIKLVVQYTTLTAVNARGAATVTSENVIQGDSLNIKMSGAGNINLNVELKILKVTISGAGTVTLKGTVREQTLALSGAGALEAYELISQQSKIDISGVGSASIHVLKKLEASVSGVGGISYRGDPEEIVSDISGLGTIDKAKEKHKK